ncbi:amiloride-sensitive amine oxidase [copper-containing] [Zootoca vivipara]|uniref:amiloride-sensitive amine oxidase [copper-containing] n=1 Tax=Zootoca vivipara TaxID=8524 RepID=UPI001591B429|nr:amiloride-sensitive amine oxidase [copper-containing] [Zootoca vivipara]XP_034986054.1 amiloride-sensitive amine oxidase [copper-containing] [Zootoca vivipara]XP_034986055.1 amiloride-sensitive amine oxidase [copper-containing] [Zootoca vivipara]
MWSSALAVLGLLAWSASGLPPQRQKGVSIFSDLTPAELRAVRDFLMGRPELGLRADSTKSLAKNSLFLVELLTPKKGPALQYLESGGRRPRRQARAVVFFGAEAQPNVTEYAVWPLPAPTSYRPWGKPAPFAARPGSQLEFALLSQRLEEILAPLQKFLRDASGSFGFENCGDRCLVLTEVAPRGLASGERRTWLILQRFVEGYFLHPVGLEVLLDHQALDPRLWHVQKLWYNGRYFSSPEELAQLYALGAVPVVPLPPLQPEESLFSTFVPRGNFSAGPPTDAHGAKVCEPQGRRYSVSGNLVEYSGWSLAYRLRSSTGLQLFDVRFNGERVAYEVSVQEAIAVYGGNTPAAMQTKYIDVGWGMGSVTHELAPGVDCPEGATFLDAHHLYDAEGPVHFPRAVCVFELPTGVPLRRHFDSDFHGGSHFYAGVEGTALVLRAMSTVYNYDYIWDFLLYPNGVLETKVHATGYVHATFYTPQGLRYGNRLQKHVLGNIHTHLVHYKVDLDVAGLGNSFKTLDVALENISLPWEPSRRLVQPRLDSRPRLRERQAAFPFGKPLPRYLLFGNPERPNRWGHRRSYRLQLSSHADRVLPRGWQEERGITWSRYPLAVTQHHDNEDTSSSLYIQNDPWSPTVSFENFLQNDESLENKDLVAWVTVGFLHIPHSEDIPNTSTPGNVVGFYLRPFNFFDEDPSVASRRTIIVRPSEPGGRSGVHVERWTPANPMPCVSKEPFSYNGTYWQV